MPNAGGYRDRLEWLKQTKGTASGFGEKPSTYPSQGFLWCAVEDVAAGRVTEKESERQQTTATVRIRNYPAVAPGDRLHDVGRGELWTVRTVARGDNETRAEVDR